MSPNDRSESSSELYRVVSERCHALFRSSDFKRGLNESSVSACHFSLSSIKFSVNVTQVYCVIIELKRGLSEFWRVLTESLPTSE